VAPAPCEKCADHKGMWLECVVAPDEDTDKRMRGGCASCTFSMQGSTCSLYRREGNPSRCSPLDVAFSIVLWIEADSLCRRP
jgi:hypothetical protein